MDALLEQPLISGDGTTEHCWLESDAMNRVPTFPLAALLVPGTRMVVVAPHPDDEVLGSGGLMRFAAQAHHEVVVVSVTDGEGSHPRHDPVSVKRVRNHERAHALRTLGLEPDVVHRICIPDGSVLENLDGLVGALDGLLKDGDTVFSPWDCDGHPDHEATTLAARAIGTRRALRMYQVPIWGWHWCAPEGFPWSRAIRVALDPETVERKALALECFRSQIEDDLDSPILSQRTLDHFRRPFEVFLT